MQKKSLFFPVEALRSHIKPLGLGTQNSWSLPIDPFRFHYDVMGGKVGTKWREYNVHENMHVFMLSCIKHACFHVLSSAYFSPLHVHVPLIRNIPIWQ